MTYTGCPVVVFKILLRLKMKFIAVPILILLLMTQTFSKWFVLMSFKLNQDYIAKNICENRYRPQMHCNGNCVLMKKMKQEEKQEQNAPAPGKVQLASIVLSSKSFFATVEPLFAISATSYTIAGNWGKPIDRAGFIFHPPAI